MLQELSILMAGLTAIIPFIFGLENYSAEIEQIAGDRFRRLLSV
jgi:phosphate:Na+ symporter